MRHEHDIICTCCKKGEKITDDIIKNSLKNNEFLVIPIINENFIYTLGLWRIYGIPELIFFNSHSELNEIDVAISIFQVIRKRLASGDLVKDDFDHYEVLGAEYNSSNGSNIPFLGYIGCLPMDSNYSTMKCVHPLGRCVKFYGSGKFPVKRIFISGPDLLLPWHREAVPSFYRNQISEYFSNKNHEDVKAIIIRKCYLQGCRNNNKSTCSGCKITKYCSVKCQKVDWKRHKQVCHKIKIYTQAQEKARTWEEEQYTDINAMD